MANDNTRVKILGISGSPRHANTETAIKMSLEAAQSTGYADVEYLSLADYKLLGCTGCMKCFGWQAPADGELTCYEFPEDEMRLIAPKLLEADGLIFGSPVYVIGVTALARTFMEKLHWFGFFSFTKWYGSLFRKPIGLVTVVGNAGHELVLEHMWGWALGLGMIPVVAPPTSEISQPMSSIYGATVSAIDAASIYSKRAITREGQRTVPPAQGVRNERALRSLGKNVVSTAQILNLGKQAALDAGIPPVDLLSFKKYSVKPKPGSFVEKLIKEGRVQWSPQAAEAGTQSEE